MVKNLSTIRQTVRQILKDEFVSGIDYDFKPDELDIHIGEALIETSQACPYEVRETVESDGTIEIDLSDIEDLIGDKVEKVEYPTGSEPPDYIYDFSIFGNTLTLNTRSAPTLGENIYLYCHKVHTLTESASTLTSDLEKVLVDGAIALTARSWLGGEMRKQIIPNTMKWYHAWANEHYTIYQKGLDSITPVKAWEY